jgi:lysophospholipase L1-like esterase
VALTLSTAVHISAAPLPRIFQAEVIVRNLRLSTIPPMRTLLALLLLAIPLSAARAEHEGKIQILLLGDSTIEAAIPKQLHPKDPAVEDVIDLLLAAEGDLPPTHTINLGLSGEYLRRLIDSGRYDKAAASLPGIDYIIIRYGINDAARREGFDANFANDFYELIARLRSDHPAAAIFPTSIIPYKNEADSAHINGMVQEVAKAEGLAYFDLYTRYAAELKANGPNSLNYRRYPVKSIPEKLLPLVQPFIYAPRNEVVVDGIELDAHFAKFPGWFSDRHPNSAGYHVIADETAKFLAPLIRARKTKDASR